MSFVPGMRWERLYLFLLLLPKHPADSMKQLFFFCAFFFVAHLAKAQGSGIFLHSRAEYIAQRLAVKGNSLSPYHSAIRPYLRGDVVSYALQLEFDSTRLTPLDRADLRYLYNDNDEWLGKYGNGIPLLYGVSKKHPAGEPIVQDSVLQAFAAGKKQFSHRPFCLFKKSAKPFCLYSTPANLYEINQEHFHLRANPILNFRMDFDAGDKQRYVINQRGIVLRGDIDNRLFFHTRILENQMRFPDYVRYREEQHKALPGAGYHKYEAYSKLFKADSLYDYLLSDGYIAFYLSPHIGMQLGHGRNFIGEGYRSLLLSDFATDYFYLKFNWRVWKLHYQNLFAEMALESVRESPERVIPKKYMAAHYLSYEPVPQLSLGFYEAVVFSRPTGFELQYLNPVILYRTVEHLLGSPDNVLIGLTARYNFKRHVQFYSQLMLDEFVFEELFIKKRKWWANKYGVQLGLKYIDAFGIDHLDLQVEANWVRPYTYTHFDSTATYSHYSQPLAHPLGANFIEYVGILRYQPSPRWFFKARVMRAEYGEDTADENWGSDILTSYYNNRQVTEGSVIGQGIRGQTLLAGLEVAYELRHNLTLEADWFYRKKISALPERNELVSYVGLGIRLNVARFYMDY